MTKGIRLTMFFAALSFSMLISCATVSDTNAAKQEPVPSSPESVCPLLNGQKIPAVMLKSSENETFDLAASVMKKPTILIFYRGGW